MNASVRYAVGCCLQVVGLLNAVFLVGVPIWLVGRRLCHDARTPDTPPPPGDRPTAGVPIGTTIESSKPDEGVERSAETVSPSETDSRSRRRVPLRRN